MPRDRLPTFLVIGAMKCGTTALHAILDRHPEVATSDLKEVNFFFGPPSAAEADWRVGTWGHGFGWYAERFPAGTRVRGEASPGYTSPDHPEAAERIAGSLPDVRLVYLVRDPLERAVSQWLHHRRDGDEPLALADALLSPERQYVARSRFHERLVPFLERFDREQLLVVDQADLAARPEPTLRRISAHIGADPDWWRGRTPHPATERQQPPVDDRVRAAFAAAVADDQRLLTPFVWRPPRPEPAVAAP